MAADDPEHPEVEQRAADAQQPVLVELGGPRGPAELVVAVAPQVPDDEGRQADVGDDDEEELVHARAPGNDGMGSRVVSGAAPLAAPGLNCGLANGASPTSSSGGPSAARRRTASRSSPRSGGSVAVTASIRLRPRRAHVAQREPQQLQPGAVVEHQVPAEVAVDGGGELEDDAQVVGQLRVVELEPGPQVGLLEAQQRHPALAGVAVGEVGQEEVAAPPGVEGLDVVGLELRQRRGLEVGQEGPDRVPDRGRQAVGGRPEQVGPGEQVLVGVVEEQRDRLPHDRQLRPGAGSGFGRRPLTSPAPFGGNSPGGEPLPSQLSRLTRAPLFSGPASESEVCRSWSIWKFSTAIGVGHARALAEEVVLPAAVLGDRALGGQLLQGVRLLGVRGRDDVALVVLRDREEPVHVVHLLLGHADRGRDRAVGVAAHVDVAHVAAHGGELLEHGVDRADVAGREQLGEVLDRDPQRVDRGEEVALVLGVLPGLRDDVDDGRERRDVPDHGHGAVLRVQRQRDLVGVDQRVDRGALGGVDPVAGDAGLLRLADHLGVEGVEEDVALGLVEPLVVGRSRRPRAPCRRRTASGRCSAADRRRSRRRRWAGRPRCAGSRRCTSRPCRCGG